MADFADQDFFDEFAAPFPEDDLEWLQYPDEVQRLSRALPFCMRQLLENLVARAREDIFYGQYGRWHVVSEIGNGLYQVVRWRRGLHQARQYQLSVARSLESRWRPWYVNWFALRENYNFAFPGSAHLFLALMGESAIVHTEGEYNVDELPDELPVGDPESVLDLRSADPIWQPMLVISHF